jgi:hypothetical protein
MASEERRSKRGAKAMTDEPTKIESDPKIVDVEHPEPHIVGEPEPSSGQEGETPEARPIEPVPGQTSMAEKIGEAIDNAKGAEPEPAEGQS